MPIKPENVKRYPANWREISIGVREGAGWKCEGIPGEPPCRARQGYPHPITGAIVMLTVAHLDHQPENCDPENLRALCQRCHNRYDQPHRRKNAGQTRRAAKQNLELFQP